MIHSKTQFITKQIRLLKNKELAYLSRLKSIVLTSNTNCIATLPSYASFDNKSRNLILSRNIIKKIERDHGSVVLENLIINANDWDYVIKNVDQNQDKINLLKLTPYNTILLIGANRINGFFMLTHYEIINNRKKDKLKNLLKRGDSLNNTGGAAVPSSATFP